jgi:hypothetical protein
MKQSAARSLGGLAVLLLLAIAPALTIAGPANEPSFEHLTDAGPLSLGFGVAPLRPTLTTPSALGPGGQPAEGARATDLDAQATALSFELRLRWPGLDATSPLEPFMAVGPALFVVEPDYAARVLGTRIDPSLRLGARAGAGLNWRLGKATTLFGAYEVTAASESGRAPLGARSASDPALHGFDFTYGLRFRY